MKNLLLCFAFLLLIGCSNKNIYVKDSYKLNTASKINIINPHDDPIDLAYIILDELQKNGFNASLVHNTKVNKQHNTSSQGSGFFINQNGVIATNYHVVKNSNLIKIRTSDNNHFTAKVILSDKTNDIAILKPKRAFQAKKWFMLDKYKNNSIGDDIHVIGYPLSFVLGADVRVTKGIISSDVGIKSDLNRFQMSASIQPGNSGGPIINKNNLVVGIATSRLSDSYLLKYMDTIPQNINFGVKSNRILELFSNEDKQHLLKDKTTITSLEDAVLATVLINTNYDEDRTLQHELPKNSLSLIFKYVYHWDYNIISYLSIKLLDKDKAILVNINFTGDYFSSTYDLTRELVQEIIAKVQ